MKRVTPVVSIFAGLLMALSLSACGDKSGSGAAGTSQEMTLSPANSAFINTDVTGLGYARDFALTDHTGKPRTLADYKGKVVVVFFGYTQCPDVCPTTMVEMADVMKELGPLASKVQVLFVTVDPERDTQELLSKYVPAFDPGFVGLYGDQAATENDHNQQPGLHRHVVGDCSPAQGWRHGAGQAADDDVLRRRRFQDDGVDNCVADERGESQPHGQRIDEVVQHPHAEPAYHAGKYQGLGHGDFTARHWPPCRARHARIDFTLDQAVDGKSRSGQQPDADGGGNQALPVGQARGGQEHADHRAKYRQLRNARLGQGPVLGNSIRWYGQSGHGCGLRRSAVGWLGAPKTGDTRKASLAL